jgi:hypothetical protein
LIGAIIVLLLVVVGFVLFRGAFRDNPEYEPEPIDYRALVLSLQQAGLKPVYPAELPEGWYVKDVGSPLDGEPFDLAMTTDDGHFAGLHQEDTSIEALVDTVVGTDATEGEQVTIDSDVGSTWRSFSDPGGDHAFAAEVGDDSVLVYGSAPADELREVVESLTTDKIDPSTV